MSCVKVCWYEGIRACPYKSFLASIQQFLIFTQDSKLTIASKFCNSLRQKKLRISFERRLTGVITWDLMLINYEPLVYVNLREFIAPWIHFWIVAIAKNQSYLIDRLQNDKWNLRYLILRQQQQRKKGPSGKWPFIISVTFHLKTFLFYSSFFFFPL